MDVSVPLRDCNADRQAHFNPFRTRNFLPYPNLYQIANIGNGSLRCDIHEIFVAS